MIKVTTNDFKLSEEFGNCFEKTAQFLKAHSQTISDNSEPFKINENAVYFMLKSFFILEMFTFLSCRLGYVEK